MARVTQVKKAQQRYKTVPVIDPATGEQKQTPVMRGDGTQKKTKHGRLVFMKVTEDDRSQPLPNYTCGKCGVEIKVGDPYKHVTPKSGPYGGTKRIRCASCPTWQQWELSNSLSARVAQIVDSFEHAVGDASSEDDARSALDEAAEEIKSLAEEKREGAQNIEDGFGHETEQSQELADIADQLEDWAESLEQADVPDEPQPEDEECPECEGNCQVDNPEYDADKPAEEQDEEEMIDCDECSGLGTASEVSEDAWEAWRESVLNDSGIQECPV